ncbi:MAG: 50S ribosomal protein L10, partial [Chitinivibrionales bacterium]|nr:50S ribosomal protein L10 [Chitinivibrionales bacterium]
MSTKAERTAGIEMLVGEFQKARGIFITDNNRITVAKVTKLRNDLRKQGSRYLVVKNTLAKIALERSGKKELAPYFKGPVGVAIGYNEPTIPIKIISDFQKDNAE